MSPLTSPHHTPTRGPFHLHTLFNSAPAFHSALLPTQLEFKLDPGSDDPLLKAKKVAELKRDKVRSVGARDFTKARETQTQIDAILGFNDADPTEEMRKLQVGHSLNALSPTIITLPLAH